jgi:hypothetical protein
MYNTNRAGYIMTLDNNALQYKEVKMISCSAYLHVNQGSIIFICTVYVCHSGKKSSFTPEASKVDIINP